MLSEPEIPGIPSLAADEVASGTAIAIARADAMISEALALSHEATFDDVFGRIDHAGRLIGQAYGRFALPSQVHPDEAVRDAANEAREALERWTLGLAERDGVADLVDRFSANDSDLDEEQAGLLRRWTIDVRETGADLTGPEREELARLKDVLLGVPRRFFPALLRPVEVRIAPNEIEGVPDAIVALFGDPDTEGGWAIPLSDPIFNGILETAANRPLRERVARGWHSRGFPDTTDLLQELITTRARVARLQGYASWMEARAVRMAVGGAVAVDAFLQQVEAPLRDRAAVELDAMRELLVEETGDPDAVVEEWDWRYLDARQRAAIGVDPPSLREYLPFEDVLAGMFRLSETVFGVRVEPRPERTSWHQDVRAFDLVGRDSGRFIAQLYVDPFAREGKAANAYMDTIDPGDSGRFGDPRPRVFLLGTNAPPPVMGPSTLGFTEVDQLFHEYGHVLDFALDRSRWFAIREDSLEFDWVEAPSLFLGQWGQTAAVIGSFAFHVETHEAIPEPMLAALAKLTTLNAAVRALRYLSMGRLDMLVHGADPRPIVEADRRAWAVRGIPFVEGSSFAGTFLHLVAGYHGAVYGFLWDQALRDDIFTSFAPDPTSPEVGGRYRATVLEAPWTEDPLDGLRRFLGRDWSPEPLLARIQTGALGG